MAYTRSESKCRQKFSQRRLMVVDPSAPEKGVFTDFFRIPTACSCSVSASESIVQTVTGVNDEGETRKQPAVAETTALPFPIDVFSLDAARPSPSYKSHSDRYSIRIYELTIKNSIKIH